MGRDRAPDVRPPDVRPPDVRPPGVRPPGVVAVAALLAMLAVVVAASVAVGARTIALPEVWEALVAPRGTPDDLVVRALRVPRTVLGLLVGAALGVAGALMQGHTRNPLADPGLLGVTHGAAFAVVAATLLFGLQGLSTTIWFAFAGAAVASVVVFLLGTAGGRGSTPVTLALAGAAVSALLNALVSAMVLADRQGMEAFRFWQVGTIAARDASVAASIAPFLAFGMFLALVNAAGMNTLALGDDAATALGTNVRRTRAVGVLAITVLTGAAVAACGPIAFLGLVVPHVARAMVGPDHRWLVPVSGTLGAVLLLGADVLGRVVGSDSFEVGILLAFVGAPVFVVLVRRRAVVRL